MGLIFERKIFDILSIFIFLITIVFFYIKYLVSYWNRRNVKSLNSSFPLGNFNKLLRMSIGETFSDIYKSTKEPFIGIYAVFRPMLFVRDPELIHHILSKDFQCFMDRGMYCDEDNDPLSAHLFALEGPKWKELRTKLTPAFTSGKLRAMYSTLIECGSRLQQHIDNSVQSKQIIEVREIAAKYSTNVIASVAFGLDIDCFSEENQKFREYGKKALQPDLRNAIIYALSFLLPGFLKTLKIRTIRGDVEDFMRSIVEQTLEYREKNGVVRKDFFQLLVQLRNAGAVQPDGQWQTVVKKDGQKAMTLNQITAQAYVFYLAGFETSSSTFAFCLYELAKNPEIQRKVHEEIDRVLGKYNDEINYDSVAEMKYLDCCIDETLRKYPPLSFLNRQCVEKYRIPGTDVVIEKGTSILISLLGLHWDEQFYPEPEKFIPERFNDENFTGKNPINRPYLPFGDGPRNCIGLRLGKVQTKVGLISVLRQYQFDLSEKHIEKPLKFAVQGISLTPADGIELKCSRRGMKKTSE